MSSTDKTIAFSNATLQQVPLYRLHTDLSGFVTRAMQLFLETNRHKLAELGHSHVNDGLSTFLACQKLFVEHSVAVYIERILPNFKCPGVDKVLVLAIAQAAYEKNMKEFLGDVSPYTAAPGPNMVAVPVPLSASSTASSSARIDFTSCPIVKPVPRPASSP
jgi:hypothetical protein